MPGFLATVSQCQHRDGAGTDVGDVGNEKPCGTGDVDATEPSFAAHYTSLCRVVVAQSHRNVLHTQACRHRRQSASLGLFEVCSQVEQFVDRPLVVSVGSVFAGQYRPGGV
jgi:hypothetical protein